MGFRTLAFLAILLLPSQELHGAAASDVHGMVAEMTAWTVGATDYAAPPPPRLAVVNQAYLKELCFPGCADADLPFVQGAYDPRVETVFLDATFDADLPLHRSYLLHEVVHHVQLANDADETARCREELEGEALRLQVRWLREEEGVDDPLDYLGIDELTLLILGSCPAQ